jgi:hypothetical protein
MLEGRGMLPGSGYFAPQSKAEPETMQERASGSLHAQLHEDGLGSMGGYGMTLHRTRADGTSGSEGGLFAFSTGKSSG